MWEQYWTGRGQPWEHDPGPAASSRWLELFAETPNYRGLGMAWTGREAFRWHFGPMFYRGRTVPGRARVLVVGQEGAQDESLSHRSFTGSTGGRLQHILDHLGITRSYLFLNTFVYPIFGQYGDDLRPLAQDLRSPIARHRQALLDLAASEQDLRLVIAVGLAAKESVATWIRSKGGDAEPELLHLAEAGRIRPGLRAVGIPHPGGAGSGVSTTLLADEIRVALGHVDEWIAADPGWLPTDPGGDRHPAAAYTYDVAPLPFRDLPFGTTWRLGNGTTSSNRRDDQSSVQLFSAGGQYNNIGDDVTYAELLAGSDEGYEAPAGDLPYEPPRHDPGDRDPGPAAALARLLMGGEPGLAWPDFAALGLTGHPSFGFGPVYRGRLRSPSILVLADEASPDDLLTGRALSGEAGQRVQALLAAAGVERRYAVLRTLPVGSAGAGEAHVRAAVEHPSVVALLREVARRAAPAVVLATGPNAGRIAGAVAPGGVPVVALPAWDASGSALAAWRQGLAQLAGLPYPKDRAATFAWDGRRSQLPRRDLPYGTLRWLGTSGDRAQHAQLGGTLSPDYVKLTLPAWVAALPPAPLSPSEQAALDDLRQ